MSTLNVLSADRVRLAWPVGMSCRARQPQRAFTLIEVLVVVAIIALLVAILLPSLQRARAQARRVLCLNNLHQLSVALYTYQADYKGSPPRWVHYDELSADGLALWVLGITGPGHATRLGMLYPRYVGKNENVFFCPDATRNGLLNKDESYSAASLYPWRHYGTDIDWAYGSYEYRPRYYFGADDPVWVGANYGTARASSYSIAADGFAGSWDSFGPYPAHTPIQNRPRMLLYNVAFMDGSAKEIKDFPRPSTSFAGAVEFGTRAAALAQVNPYINPPREGGTGETNLPPEYTPLRPGARQNPPLPPPGPERENILKNTDHIDRGWTFFEKAR